MGRSRGGLTTKIHALVDAEGRPIDIVLTPGQTHDSQPAPGLLEGMKQGAILLADKAYDSNAIRERLSKINAWANIPTKKNRKQTFPFSKWLYRYRNLVERFFNIGGRYAIDPVDRLPAGNKQFRGLATRYDKNADNFLAAIKFASLRIWIRAL